MGRVSRRAFVAGTAGLGLLAGCGRSPLQGQRPARVARIGFLRSGSSAVAGAAQAYAFRPSGTYSWWAVGMRLAAGDVSIVPPVRPTAAGAPDSQGRRRAPQYCCAIVAAPAG